MQKMFRSFFSTSINHQAADIWLLLLRISVASLMLTHGLPKLSKLLSGDLQFADPLGIGMVASLALAVFAEVICSVLIFFGVVTRIAAIPIIILMTVAAFVVHQDDPFAKQEVPLLYLLLFLTLLIFGGGKYAVDNKIYESWKNGEKYYF